MDTTRAVGVGVFVVGGLLLFAAGLFMIGDRRLLFREHVEIHAEFPRLAGLQNGALVRVAGMDAGEVTDIAVPVRPSDRFRVRMRVWSALHPLVRTNSVASIQSDGLMGAKYVRIEAGTDEAAIAPDGGTIRGEEPFELGDLLGQMRGTVAAVNEAIADLRAELETATATVTDTALFARTTIQDVGEDLTAITESTAQITDDVRLIVEDIRAGRGTIGQLVTDDTLYRQAEAIAEDARRTVASVREAADRARRIVDDLEAERGPVGGLTADLRHTVQFARDAMANLAENTEALKRNWFFRGFFERRGFYDLDRLAVDDYRDGALETRGRHALRIWLGADVLFETDAEGRERLSDGGRRRLDSAMGEFVRHAATSPLVVEGYALEGAREERFLTSRRRAGVVRDYLVATFQLPPNLTGVMPMGREARDSPAGDRWDGVALALFVDRRDLR